MMLPLAQQGANRAQRTLGRQLPQRLLGKPTAETRMTEEDTPSRVRLGTADLPTELRQSDFIYQGYHNSEIMFTCSTLRTTIRKGEMII